MRKFVLVLTVLAVLLAMLVPAVSAQEAAFPACSQQEIDAVVTVLETYNEALAELGDLTSDPNDAAYGAVLVNYDAFSYGFWNTIYPELPACTEIQALAFAMGAFYDELATAASFANIAGWAVAADEADAAEYFVDASATRLEYATEDLEAMSEAGPEDYLGDTLPACSQEEYEASSTAVSTYFTGLGDVMGELQAAQSGDVETLAAVVVVVDTFANTYWDEVYPELPQCAEADYEAYLAGRVLDELVLVTSLALNASLESTAGNADVATTLAESATTRYTDLMDFLSQMGAME